MKCTKKLPYFVYDLEKIRVPSDKQQLFELVKDYCKKFNGDVVYVSFHDCDYEIIVGMAVTNDITYELCFNRDQDGFKLLLCEG